MEYKISEDKFGSIAGLVANIAKKTGRDIVSRYYDRSQPYKKGDWDIKDAWEAFILLQIRHMCARVAFQNVLDKKFGVSTTIRGLDTEVDWLSFVHPWSQRISLQFDTIDRAELV